MEAQKDKSLNKASLSNLNKDNQANHNHAMETKAQTNKCYQAIDISHSTEDKEDKSGHSNEANYKDIADTLEVSNATAALAT